MIKNRREAIKLLGGALGTLGAASLFADENSTNSVNFTGGEAQNSGASNSVNSAGQNSVPNSIKQNSAKNSSGNSASLYLRPPGALAERGFRSSCIKCGQCVQVCPYHSIYLLDITHLFDIGTPLSMPKIGAAIFAARFLACSPVQAARSATKRTSLKRLRWVSP